MPHIRNSTLMQKYVGKTIESIEDTNPGRNYTDPDGFVIHFTDGNQVELYAEMGQGQGYIILIESEDIL